MAPRFASLFVLFRNVRGLMVSAALVVLSATAAPVLAKTSYENPATAEGWAWARIKRGEKADFNARCKTTPPLDARANDEKSEKSWQDNCRRLPASFLVDVLTKAPWCDQVPFAGVHIVGARIVGDIDLKNARVNRELAIQQSRIEGKVDLGGARTDSDVNFNHSRLTGKLSAFQFRDERSLELWDTEFDQEVSLSYAKIDGYVSMSAARFQKNLEANSLQVGSNFFMRMRASFKGVNLTRATVDGDLDMRGSTFEGKLEAYYAHMRSNVVMLDAHFTQLTDMQFADIGGYLDLRGAALAGLDLLGASIAGELRLGENDESHRPTVWGTENEPSNLILRYARIGSLVDAKNAWPRNGHLHLDGFAVSHLGGFQQDEKSEARHRSVGVSVAGAVYLWKYSKGVCVAGHTFGWCWGASLARLLPVIEINKEFTEFFNDPERKRLTGFQMGVFSFIGVLGWFFAAILVAAISGVTGKS